MSGDGASGGRRGWVVSATCHVSRVTCHVAGATHTTSLWEVRHTCAAQIYGYFLISGKNIRVPRLRKSASFQPFHGMVNQRLAGMNGVVAGL